jgi:hypothetical protein
VAVFVTEENAHQPVLAGYAQPVDPAGLPGVYSFTFGDPLEPDGSYFISARVEMIDPAQNVNPAETPDDLAEQAQGFGAFAASLKITVDTAPPPVYFGDPAVPADGLIPDPGVVPQPPLFDDNKTNDTTPTFWGTAEANSVVRVYADNEVAAAAGDGTLGLLDPFDVLIGMTVALPEDGSNQFPHGQWRVSSPIDLNDDDFFDVVDGLRTIFATAEDVPGNVNAIDAGDVQTLQIFVDTQGPQVTGVFATNLLGLLPGNTLLRFNAASPDTIEGQLPITGLLAGDTIVGIDYRPATGQVYAVADGPNPDALYTVNPETGAATFVAALSLALSGSSFGVDFNPLTDALWIVSDADINYSVHPVTGVVTPQAALNPLNPDVVAAAYTNNQAGAAQTSLYTIDSTTDFLNLQDPPAAGTQTPVGSLGFDAGSSAGFEIAAANNIAFAALTDAASGETGLYLIDLTTGQATPIGEIADGTMPLLGLTAVSEYDVFDPKPSTDGPTPPLNKLFIRLEDLPGREPPFDNPALNPLVAEVAGNYTLIGDHNGIIPIMSVQFIPDPVMAGQPAEGTVVLMFFEPLPDDRFTLVLSDSLVDDLGNALDGESNADEPQETPWFPSGDGQPGGDFVARFTVDTRAELGVWAGGSVYVDTNGNFVFDPQGKDNDNTNEDISYVLGWTTDNIFAGNFAALSDDPATLRDDTLADGFDKLAAYGRVAGVFRWLIDTDNNGVPNVVTTQPHDLDGLPAAGEFNGRAFDGDEVALKVGNVWYLDRTHNYRLSDGGDVQLSGDMFGYPIVGDFDGDGVDDLGAWSQDYFRLDLSTMLTGGVVPNSFHPNINGVTDVTFRFGFIGDRERPVAADFDGDGIDDLGLWVPDRSGAAAEEQAEWYVLVSHDRGIQTRIQETFEEGRQPENIVDFVPQPFGYDIFARMGDEYALPVVGNYDPPVSGAAPPQYQNVSYTNPLDPLDVNGDGALTPQDLLIVINAVNTNGVGALFTFRSEVPLISPFIDPTGDLVLSASDALIIVNALNDQAGLAVGEGESPAVVQLDTPVLRSPQPAGDDTAGQSAPLVNSGNLTATFGLPQAVVWQDRTIIAKHVTLSQPPMPVREAGSAATALVFAALDDGGDDDLEALLDELADDIAGAWL